MVSINIWKNFWTTDTLKYRPFKWAQVKNAAKIRFENLFIYTVSFYNSSGIDLSDRYLASTEIVGVEPTFSPR